MSTPTDLQPAAGAVLTHPAFDRPPVHNDRRRGRKKGTHSLAIARRERDAANARFLIERGHHLMSPERRAAYEETRAYLSGIGAKNDAATAAPATARSRHDRAVIDAALAIIEAGLSEPGQVLNMPSLVKDYLRLQLADREREVFGVIFLDATHAVIAFEVLFEGTLTHTSVHPRVVAQRALALNAAAVVLAHNHPSGIAEPSRADEVVTATLRQALSTLDVRVLDHIVVGRGDATSFAERGLL